MPEYLSPGVYVEEVEAGPKPIEGVSTSTAGAVGVTARGPSEGKPVLVTSFADFVRRFGASVDATDAQKAKWSGDRQNGGEFWSFPLSVRGFFDNGGQRLYVRRVVSSTATAASVELSAGIIAIVDADAADTSTAIKLSSLVGVATGATLDLWVDGVKSQITVKAYDSATRVVALQAALGKRVRAGRDYVVVVAGSNAAPKVKLRAKATGGWANEIRVRVRPTEAATLNLLANEQLANNPRVVTKIAADANAVDAVNVVAGGAANLVVGDRVTIAGEAFAITAIAGDKLTLDRKSDFRKDTPVTRVLLAHDGGAGVDVYVWGASGLYKKAIVELDDGNKRVATTVAAVDGKKVTLGASPGVKLWEGQKLRLVEAEVRATYAPAEGEGAVDETFTSLRLVDDPADPAPSYIITRLKEASSLVEVESPLDLAISTLDAFPTAALSQELAPGWAELEDGDDDLDALTVDDFIGVDGGPKKRTGIQALEDIDEVSIAMVPGIWAAPVHGALIQHCELLKDRFAIIDPPRGLDIENIRAFREPIDTKYAALYYPWIDVRDPFLRRNTLVGPSSHLAGVYARVDVDRGVHKAPANEVVRGVAIGDGRHGLELEITKREQDLLNPRGINALRFFPNRSTRVWGARTLSSDPSWRYVNVRRLFIFVEESIDEGTQWVVFEPNDEPTWARVRHSVANFLTTVWRSGALQGARAEDAFFVRCDYTTMTQDDIDNGRLICVVGMAPVKPAEFVIFRIQQKTMETQSEG